MSTIRLDRSERINSTYVSNARKEKGKIQVFIIGLVTECEVCSGAETLVWRRSLWAYRRGCLFYFIFSPFLSDSRFPALRFLWTDGDDSCSFGEFRHTTLLSFRRRWLFFFCRLPMPFLYRMVLGTHFPSAQSPTHNPYRHPCNEPRDQTGS